MMQQNLGQRRTISGHFAMGLLRDVGAILDGVVAPRVPASDDIQRSADAALKATIDGHDVKNWHSAPGETLSELSRRWLALAGECASFADATMLSLPWGTTDRMIRDMLLAQMMQEPALTSSLAA